MNSDEMMICSLPSGRSVMLVINEDSTACSYRYLSEEEVNLSEFSEYGLFNWIDKPINMDVDYSSNEYFYYVDIDGFLVRWYDRTNYEEQLFYN